MSKTYSIWKVKGHHKDKFKFFLSCFLIYPIFRRHKYEKYIWDLIEFLNLYLINLKKVIEFRQNLVKELYKKWNRALPKIIKELCSNVIEDKVTLDNMNSVEFSIEAINQLLNSSVHCDGKVAYDFNESLKISEQEYEQLIHAYHSILGKLNVLLRHKASRYVSNIFEIEKFNLNF